MMNRNVTVRFRCDGLGKSYDLTHYDLIRQEGPARFAVSGFSQLGLRLELEIENRGDDAADVRFDVHWPAFDHNETYMADNFDYYYVKHKDDDAWTMIPGVRNKLVNEVRFRSQPGTTVVSAVSVPYALSDNDNFLDSARNSGAATVEVVGESQEGRPIHLVTFSTGGKKENCLVVARCHGYETAGNYNVEGMAEFLASDHPLANYFLANYNVCLIPVMNPDGVANGQERLTAFQGADLNRDFECNKRTSPGSENDKALITHFDVIDSLKPSVYLNIHNWSFKYEDGLMGFDQDAVDGFTSFMPDQIQDCKRWRTRVFGAPSNKTSPGRYCRDAYGTRSIVLEFPWFGRSVPRMRELGKEALSALLNTTLSMRLSENSKS